MALELQIELPSGVVANYWRLGRLVADRVSNKMEARLDLYLNKETRDSGRKSVLSKTVYGTINPLGVDTNYIEEAYIKIKTPVYDTDPETEEQIQVNPFVNAIDVLEE